LILLPSNSGASAKGLSQFYNQAIEASAEEAILVFLHDDVYVHDWQLHHQLHLALAAFDLVGVVGSAAVPFGQPGWWHDLTADGKSVRNDAVKRSGSINHFDPHWVRPDFYGESPMVCDLLDGVFLAVRRSTLHKTGLRFDPTFRFHCYDTDFCYTARSLGLKLGTWPVSLTHGSPGSFGAGWQASAKLLKQKLKAT
jgi:GT2 family glycosyltransferase